MPLTSVLDKDCAYAMKNREYGLQLCPRKFLFVFVRKTAQTTNIPLDVQNVKSISE